MPAADKPLVLVVDDDAAVAETLALVLQSAAFLTVVAHSGRGALDQLARTPADVALVDVNLPDIDGVNTAIEVCRRLPACKILLISGHPDAAPLIERMGAAGLNFEVLPKPIQPRELIAAVSRELLDHACTAGGVVTSSRNVEGKTQS